jgi:signal transduction histidine kinase
VRLTPRRRAVIALLLAAVLGFFFVGLDAHLAYQLALISRGGASCPGGGLWHFVDSLNGCGSSSAGVTIVVELIVVTAVGLVIAYGLARWVLVPVVSIADTVARFGPNSLGLRLRMTGARDEIRQLGDAIDDMLDRLAEGYDAQRRFAANASHELRTPLATQRALIEISLSAAPTPEQLDLLSRQLLATNERNERLVDGLLVLAETDRGLLSRSAVNLDAVTDEVVAMLEGSAREAAVDLQLHAVPTLVAGEAALLERLVGNLVQNAIKYNERGGRVEVTVAAPGTLTVSNTGPRVPPESVAALFEPFRRLSGDRLDHGGGVGLGLTISRSIVAAHGGSIDARANPDGGLTVRVSLPPG